MFWWIEDDIQVYLMSDFSERKVYKVLVGKPEGKRPPGKPRCRWENGS
jgi:hypothetical protein